MNPAVIVKSKQHEGVLKLNVKTFEVINAIAQKDEIIKWLMENHSVDFIYIKEDPQIGSCGFECILKEDSSENRIDLIVSDDCRITCAVDFFFVVVDYVSLSYSVWEEDELTLIEVKNSEVRNYER